MDRSTAIDFNLVQLKIISGRNGPVDGWLETIDKILSSSLSERSYLSGKSQ